MALDNGDKRKLAALVIEKLRDTVALDGPELAAPECDELNSLLIERLVWLDETRKSS